MYVKYIRVLLHAGIKYNIKYTKNIRLKGLHKKHIHILMLYFHTPMDHLVHRALEAMACKRSRTLDPLFFCSLM